MSFKALHTWNRERKEQVVRVYDVIDIVYTHKLLNESVHMYAVCTQKVIVYIIHDFFQGTSHLDLEQRMEPVVIPSLRNTRRFHN